MKGCVFRRGLRYLDGGFVGNLVCRMGGNEFSIALACDGVSPFARCSRQKSACVCRLLSAWPVECWLREVLDIVFDLALAVTDVEFGIERRSLLRIETVSLIVNLSRDSFLATAACQIKAVPAADHFHAAILATPYLDWAGQYPSSSAI